MSRLTRDGTAEPVSRDQILRHVRGQGNIHFPLSADYEQDWQPYPVDPYSGIFDEHTYIHAYSRVCIHWTYSPVEYNVQTPRFLGFQYICATTYNRGMSQDMIFNRVELAQPDEYSWPAAPYHANIPVRKSIQYKKNRAINS